MSDTSDRLMPNCFAMAVCVSPLEMACLILTTLAFVTLAGFFFILSFHCLQDFASFAGFSVTQDVSNLAVEVTHCHQLKLSVRT